MRISKFLVFEYHMNNLVIRLLLVCFMVSTHYASAQPVVRVVNYFERESPCSQQGAAAYGKYLFLFSEKGVCNIYDLDTKAYLGQMEYEESDIKHCDTACFGIHKVEEKDEFPVVYISGSQVDKLSEKGLIWVYRIIHDDEKWNMKLYQVIRTPVVKDVGSFPDALSSNSDGCIWIIGWDTNRARPSRDGCGAYLKITKFKTPALKDGAIDKNGIRLVDFSMSESITSFIVNNAHSIQQGLCLKNQKIYVPYGLSAFGYQGIDIISLEERRVVQNINLMGTSVGEPEATFFYKGEMFIADGVTSIKRIVDYREDE